jgi:DNA polymerase III sliding clamp (beta) subunit (PCNA family)
MSDILGSLRFVQGSVAKKDFLPAMTHFVIEKGTVRGYNGMIALCSPIAFDIDCKPKADELVHAITHCDEQIVLSMTEAGRLRVVSGNYKAFVKCVTEETPHVLPDGEVVTFPGAEMLEALKIIEPFIGDDASRPWSNGVLLRGSSAIATNNVTIIEYWVGAAFPRTVNVPHVAIKEMLRIGEAPVSAQLAERSITFHYTNNRWIRSQLLNTEWPDVNRILSADHNARPIDDRLFVGLEKLKKRSDKMNRVFIKGDVLTVTTEQGEEAAQYTVPGLQCEGAYSIPMLDLLHGVAEAIDFSSYPRPCLFFGKQLRGAIIGMKMA